MHKEQTAHLERPSRSETLGMQMSCFSLQLRVNYQACAIRGLIGVSDISLLLEEAGGALEEAASPGDLSLTQSNQSDINNAERLTSEDNQSSSHMDCLGKKCGTVFL